MSLQIANFLIVWRGSEQTMSVLEALLLVRLDPEEAAAEELEENIKNMTMWIS